MRNLKTLTLERGTHRPNNYSASIPGGMAKPILAADAAITPGSKSNSGGVTPDSSLAPVELALKTTRPSMGRMPLSSPKTSLLPCLSLASSSVTVSSPGWGVRFCCR